MTQISVFGQTDTRVCIYTLLRILQPMGDVLLFTTNPHYSRLLESGENHGYYQNIAISILSDLNADPWEGDSRSPNDYDYVVMDGFTSGDPALCIYMQGAGVEARDAYLFDAFDDMLVIKLGKGRGNVRYTADTWELIELVEYYRKLVVPAPTILPILAKALSPMLHIPVKTIVKVASRK